MITGTGTTPDRLTTIMIGDAPEATLTAFQLTDSFLPVGSYTASYGLESFAQKGVIEDATDIHALLEDYLRKQVGPCDMVAVRGAHEATRTDDLDRLIAVDNRFHAATLTEEFRTSSTASGTQLLDLGIDDDAFVATYREHVDTGAAHGHYGVVLGILTSQSGIGVREACLMHGYSFVSGLLGAAQRLLRLSHTTVQTVLDDLKSTVVAAWDENRSRDIDDMGSFIPSIELMSMNHERSERRLFMS